MTTRRKTGTGRTQKAAPAKRPAASRLGKVSARQGAPRTAALAADCTIAQAMAIKAQLAKVVSRPAAVTLDLSCIRRIDTAGFQVLAAFVRERRAAGHDVQFHGASDAFSVTANLLGLGALFGTVSDDRLLRTPAAGRA
jgi:ABC-type transporter Mla MlaB component